jgi:cobalt-precorrin-5B (C1)-methyltransferase
LAKARLRSGITTGACAAAAAKAAVMAWRGQEDDNITVLSPQGNPIGVSVEKSVKTPKGAIVTVIKDAGDDPDITHGVEIVVEVEITDQPEIVIQAGEGVGTVTKPGLSVPVGEPAINPGPRKMIIQTLKECLPGDRGAVVTISIPEGEKLAKRTLNPGLGIVGGLSVIGTTGIVTPMSEEAFKASLAPQISMVKALGYEDIVFAPGKIGQDIAGSFKLPPETVIQTSNFIGFMLEQAVQYQMKRVLLFGHLGKLVKIAAGVFHTHNRMADARMETIAAYLAAQGATSSIIREILDCTTTEAAMPIIEQNGWQSVYGILAERASKRAMKYVFNDLVVGTVIVTLQGEILGLDDNAREIGGQLGWTIKS